MVGDPAKRQSRIRLLDTIKRSVESNKPGTIIAAIALLFHFFVNLSGGYGYFRDEFYYLACSDRLAFGYVDHPPLSILLLWLNRAVLGDSIFALRFLPAVASAVLVFVTGLIVREFNGRTFAQTIASVTVFIAGVYLSIGSFYSMNAFEPLCWIGSAYIVIRILNTGNDRLWLAFGAIAGLGLQNKHSMLFFGFALISALVLLKRSTLESRYFWFGGIIAFLFFLPNVIWMAMHDWATFEFMRNAQQWKNAPMSSIEFFSAQILLQNPITIFIWMTGLFALLFQRELKRYRAFGIAFLLLFILFVVQRGKPYYLSPIYPILLAAGAVYLEHLMKHRGWRILLRGYSILVVCFGIALIPLASPIMPIEIYICYERAIGLSAPKMERHGYTILPQIFADRFGWNEMVSATADVYHSLTPEEKRRTVIYAQNYGEAGAIDFLGDAYGLPDAVSGHNNYWLWGNQNPAADIVIIIGGQKEDHQEVFTSVNIAKMHSNPYAMPYETDLPIYICRGPSMPLDQLWDRVKHYI